MPKIMYMRTAYDGSNQDHIELTQAEYDALPVAEKHNGKVYFIKDAIDNRSCPFPVGGIYMSVSNVDPSYYFGGVWEQIKDKFLLSAGIKHQAGTTGGSETHTLTVNEMPSHMHDIRVVGDSNGGGTTASNYQVGIGSYTTRPRLSTLETGGGQAFETMPPYLTVYVWKRVS